MKALKKIYKLWQIPRIERVFLIKGVCLYLLFTILINTLPLKYFIGLLRQRQKESKSKLTDECIIKLVYKSINRIERFSPVTLSCFVKSCIGKMLLNSNGIENTMHLGVVLVPEGILKAHAYIKVEDSDIFLGKRKIIDVFSIE